MVPAYRDYHNGSARPFVRISWVSYLDVHVFSGGGELTQRRIIQEGERRGHEITTSAFLRHRPQRALRRSGLFRSLSIDWNADVFVLSNLQNVPEFTRRIPERDIERMLDSGRAVVMQDAWVDVCRFDVPCQGDLDRCLPACTRDFGNWLFAPAKAAIFVSPMHRDIAGHVLDVELPPTVLVHPMVDPDEFRQLGLERDIDVLYVGTINEEKGYYDLVDRFGAERLTFAGRNDLGHDVAGTYLGELPNTELPRLYNRARVFAHLPRWMEPQGRTVTEAYLCGCQVITNERVGAMSYPEVHRRDPDVVRGHPERFWRDFERVVEEWAV